VGRELGITEEQLWDLPRYRESEAFSEEERLVIDLAVEMAHTPVEVPSELMEKLRKHFDEAQLVELAAAIAWENYRARFNRVFGVESVGFSEGAFCALPDHSRQSPSP
jgi:alkylhydroperoxidase family enzyme